jgi:hypothetical protein
VPLDVRSQDSLAVGFSFFRFDLEFPKEVLSLKSAKVRTLGEPLADLSTKSVVPPFVQFGRLWIRGRQA